MTPPDDDPLDEDFGENGAGTDAARHVKQILEAAETAAEEVRSKAEREAEAVQKEAEREAAAVRQEAEAEAKRYLEDYRNRVDELDQERAQVSKTLVEQAGKMREQYNRFLETLDGALRRASDSGADLGLIDRLRGERDAASAQLEGRGARIREFQEQEQEREPEPTPEIYERDEPREEPPEERRRWPLDPRPRRREPRDLRRDPRADPRRAKEDRGSGEDSGTLRGGYRPRSRSEGE